MLKDDVILITCHLLLLLVSSSNSQNVSPNSVKLTTDHVSTCYTSECQASAAAILSAMNNTADPCQDFYQFACGGWIAKNPLPPSKILWDQFEILKQQVSSNISSILKDKKNNANDPIPVKKARDFYAACINSDLREKAGLTPLLNFLNLYGGWPMTLESPLDSYPWQQFLAAMTRLYDTVDTQGTLLHIRNYPDERNTKRNLIYIDQSNFILSRNELVNLKNNTEKEKAYKDFIIGAAKMIRTALNFHNNDTLINQDVEEMLLFEIKLAEMTNSEENRRDSNRMYNPMSLNELQEWTNSINTDTNTNINWLQLLDNIYHVGAGIKIQNNDVVVIKEKDYVKNLLTLIKITPPKTIANYLHWRIVYQLASKTNREMNRLLLQFEKVSLGKSVETPLEEICIETAKKHFGYALSYEYVKLIPISERIAAKHKILEMINNLKDAFKHLIENAKWIDPTTAEKAIDKLNNMKQQVAYPDWIMNDRSLETYYTSLFVSENNFFVSHQNVSKFDNVQMYKTLRNQEDHESWYWPPYEVSAWYYANNNTMTFPIGILLPPFFKHDRLAALNYGAFGVVIGHEISHGFDDQGKQYDKFGNLNNWWSNSTLCNFNKEKKCFIQQYESYTLSDNITHLNGETTQGENIADNGGIRAALYAYKQYVKINGPEQKLPGLEHFTSEQLFFLSNANIWCGTATLEHWKDKISTDSHCPHKFVIVGPFSNNEDFVHQFNCPAGSQMNRKNKCILW